MAIDEHCNHCGEETTLKPGAFFDVRGLMIWEGFFCDRCIDEVQSGAAESEAYYGATAFLEFEPTVHLMRDGNQWTTHRDGFRDMMQDPCGFGETQMLAIMDLLKREADAKNEPRECPLCGSGANFHVHCHSCGFDERDHLREQLAEYIVKVQGMGAEEFVREMPRLQRVLAILNEAKRRQKQRAQQPAAHTIDAGLCQCPRSRPGDPGYVPTLSNECGICGKPLAR